MSLCSQCVRSLRKQARIDLVRLSMSILLGPLLTSQTTKPVSQLHIRPLSISTCRLRKIQSQQEAVTPAPIPTTTSTITSNVTAPAPPGGDKVEESARTPAPNMPAASVSQMQKVINANLNQGNSLSTRLAEKLRGSSLRGLTSTYMTYGVTESLFQVCGQQANYTIPEDQRMGIYTGKGPPKNADQEDVGVRFEEAKDAQGHNFWFDELGLEPTFSTWSQVAFLHMYLLTVKLRTVPSHKEYLDYLRYLMEHFSDAAEDKMGLLHGMVSRGIRNRYLKEMFIQWRGLLYAYDEGMVKGDAVLAGAVWRNLWKAKEDVDWEKVALVVAYMREAAQQLDRVDLEKVQIDNEFWESCRRHAA